jgi:homoaconitase/3-isopropylmalate dehydratase large subunit
MLEVLRHPYVKTGKAIGKLVEYCGDAVESLSVDERATMTNMTAEVGGFTGYVAPDAKTVDYLMDYRKMSRADAEQLCAGLASDPGAEYCEVIEIDAARIRPMIALPGDPGNGLYIEDVGQRIKVDIAYAGSCTAGKKEDMDMYARVLAEAAGRGERVAPWVRFFIQCGSQDVKRYCEERGYLDRGVQDARGSHHQRDQSQFSGPFRSGPAVSRQSLYGGGVGHRRLHHRLGARHGVGDCSLRKRSANLHVDRARATAEIQRRRHS